MAGAIGGQVGLQVAGLVATAVVGGLLPLASRRTERGLHLLVAFATGVFLGIVFLHLLPETAALAAERGGGRIWPALLLGVVGLYLLEKLLLPRLLGADPHLAVGWGSLVGLSLHAFTTGLALAALEPDVATPVVLSVAAHKPAEGFSLATVLLLAGQGRRRIALTVGLFALITPVGLLVGNSLVNGASAGGAPGITALATGTFLYVALCNLLPESFHERGDPGTKLALLVVGVLAVAGVTWWFPHDVG